MKAIITSLALCVSVGLWAQQSTNMPIKGNSEQILQRLEIRRGDFRGQHLGVRGLSRRMAYEQAIDTAQVQGKVYGFDRQYLRRDNNDWDSSIVSKKPLWKYLYRSPAHFYELRVKDFYLAVDPVLHFEAGMERELGENRFVFTNRRGAEIRGNIGEKVYFYSNIYETQANYANYVNRRIERDFAVPSAGFFKQYDSQLTAGDKDGVDFLQAEGYISFNVHKYIGMQFGHGRHFIGDGHRSMILSNWSNNYFYAQLNTKIWKFNYRNIFAQLTQNYTERQRAFDEAFPKKYMALHHLSINILKNLNVGLFETVIFSRGGQPELQYLNPLIFYRAVEQAVGSPDNVIIGLNWKYNFLKHASFYGQFVLDELSVGDLLSRGTGWWANKYGLQAGLKYIDIANVEHLDAQVEFNMARPYLYSFRDSTANYTHYNQTLAHPLGANFYEFIGILSYRPTARLRLRGQLNYALYGQDEANTNWGGNVHKSYLQLQQQLDNRIGQGVETRLLLAQLLVSYQIKTNLVADLRLMYRKEDAEIDALDYSGLLFKLGLRLNIAEQQLDF